LRSKNYRLDQSIDIYGVGDPIHLHVLIKSKKGLLLSLKRIPNFDSDEKRDTKLLTK
jgi:hypothetical protein